MSEETRIDPRGMFGWVHAEHEGKKVSFAKLACGHAEGHPVPGCDECTTESCRSALRAGAKPIVVNFRPVLVGETRRDEPLVSVQTAATESVADAIRTLAAAVVRLSESR